jgi:hypothetical protein
MRPRIAAAAPLYRPDYAIGAQLNGSGTVS